MLRVVVVAEIDVVEPTALRQPGGEAVALLKEREGGADRNAAVAHRRKDENLVERALLRQQPIEPDVGEQAAGKPQMARARSCASQARTDASIRFSVTCWIEAAIVSRAMATADVEDRSGQHLVVLEIGARSGRRRRSGSDRPDRRGERRLAKAARPVSLPSWRDMVKPHACVAKP